MRSLFASFIVLALGLALGCSSSGPTRPGTPQSALPDCEDTNGYPPCIYRGVAPFEEPYEGGGDFYPAYDYPYFPGTGVIVIPEPVPVPTPVPKPKPPKHPPPPKHPRIPGDRCHPTPRHPCP